MARPLDAFLSRFRKPVRPTGTAGVPGRAIFGGFVQNDEKSPDLASQSQRFKTYSEILINVSIVGAGVRYFLNLASKASWNLEPTDHPESQRLTDLASEMLFNDPITPWHRIVRRAVMYRFQGFSVQEWTAKRRPDGLLTFADVAPRAQVTIERWDVEEDGTVRGFLQRSPQTSEELYIPRQKCMYLVDDTLSDSPEGLGLFRHLVEPAKRLQRYEQLEGFGFETDLRGIPIGRAPFTELAQLVEAGEISAADRSSIEAPLRAFIKNHIKKADLGLLLDSITYESKDEAGKPSNVSQWGVELLKGSATSFRENAAAIERLNREMARILGVEELLLGADSAGSFAMSASKTNNFFLLVDGALMEVAAGIEDDLLAALWALNGWPPEAKPKATNEAVRFRDVQVITSALRDVAVAGGTLALNDPVIGEVRDLMGVSRPPEVSDREEADMALLRNDGDGEDVV